MKLTSHFQKRMRQRGITGAMVDIAYMFGNPIKDRIVLTQADTKKLLKKYKEPKLQKVLKSILDKGGITLIEKDGVLLTVYNTNFNNHRRVIK